MKEITSNKLLFATAVVAGGAVWAAFGVFEVEPWDSPYGWIVVAGLGFTFGFVGKGNPILWPLDIFLGEVLFGLGAFLKSIVFRSSGGVNFFIPLGLIFLVPFSIPALSGSFAGFWLRKATNK